MATNTTNLNLKKPAQEDFYNVDDFNENFQKIDDFAGRKDNPHGVTAKQIGAWAISTNGMVANISDLNNLVTSGYYKGSNVLKNTPDTPKNGDIIIVFTWDENSVLQIYSTTQAGYPIWYRKSNFGDDGSGNPTRVWTAWKKLATTSENLNIYTNSQAQVSVGKSSNDRAILMHNDHNYVDLVNFKDSKSTTFALGSDTAIDLKDLLVLYVSTGDKYNIFGEHNKPTNDDVVGSTKITTGSYVGWVTNDNTASEIVLSFDFAPKFIILQGKASNNKGVTATFLYGCDGHYIRVYAANSVSSVTIPTVWEDNSVKLSLDDNDSENFNWSANTYTYVAIG